jgi:NAD(P)-dependent dehydrogenase (short-subunit alcohol dehydrogenase family)
MGVRLKDKVAIITGGAGGIGRAAGKRFVAEGARVLLADIDENALREAVADIGSDQASHCVTDVTDPEANQRMVALAEERYGGVDILLANAGTEGRVKPIIECGVDVFDRVIAVNVRGVWLGLKAAIPALQRRGGGSIVITSSTAGVKGAAGLSPYITSKHAVIGMMRSAALECAPLGIRVNTVNPGPVETRMMRSLEEGLAPGAGEKAREMYKRRIPLQRYGEPDDVAALMLFLASDESSFITGSVYMVDGGMTG